jgi:hypothetical protein
MSHEVTQIQVFVSCPGDVEPEKSIVRKVCDRINTLYANNGCNIHLQVRDWRDITGQFGPRPQAIINDTIKNYDVYIGILWMRFGTPPGAVNSETGSDFQSGTEEEFHLAYDEWKKNSDALNIYFFFKDSKPPNTTGETEQLLKVQQFKEKLIPLGWVNPFKDPEQFKDSVHDVLSGIALRNCLEKKTKIKEALTENLTEGKPKLSKEQLEELFRTFYNNIEAIPYYIPRTVKKAGEEQELAKQLFQVDEYDTLNEVLLKTHKVVILGNAGTGKSVELQQITARFAEPGSPFIPIYKRLNTYINEEIEDFLPEGWKLINTEILLVLLDGLDEIQPEFFNQAIRRLLTFSEKYPDIRLVISCRTNFFEIPTETSLGTLPGFECFLINDLSLDEIRKYLSLKGIDGNKFINEVYRNGYLDIVVKPFFLNILVNHFNNHNDLNSKRAEIIRGFIKSRIELDEDHFRSTVDTEAIKSEIISILQRVAFAMEMLGRNFISTEELQKVVGTQDKIKLLKYFSAFNKRNDSENSWHFEHNNIQEYLAAVELSSRTIEKIKEAISFAPSYKKIKPSWVNTLAFLISISDDSEVSELINWILSAEPEVIIKFEKDRVDKELRARLLKQIFNDYKKKGIWLRSNKFTDSELALFSQSDEVIDFLIEEMIDIDNPRIVKLNAIHILDSMNPSLMSSLHLERIKSICFQLIDNNEDDTGLIYSVLRAMSDLKLNDQVTIEKIINKLGKRYNQYIRAGIYKLLGESMFVNEYIDIFLEGIFISDDEDVKKDRESVNLADESWLLKEGLSKASSVEAIRKALKYFSDPTDRRHMNFYEKKEVFNDIIKNSIKVFDSENSLFDDIFEVFTNSGKMYELDYARPLVTFFEQTRTKTRAFHLLWNYPDIPSYEKGMLVAMLVDKEVINYFVEEYLKRNFTNEDAENLHKDLQWYIGRTNNDRSLIDYLENRLNEAGGIKLERPPVIDYDALNLAKAQRSFDVLFHPDNFLLEIKSVFDEVETDELNYDNLWEVRRKNDQLLDDYFPASVLSILRDFTRNKSTITFEALKEWISESQEFQFYRIDQIFHHLKNNDKLSISEEQRKFIEEWSNTTANEMNWEKIISRHRITDESFTINHKAEMLWFFIRNVRIHIPAQNVLAFTLFKDFSNNRDNNSTDEIDFIATILDKEIVNKKVLENIRNGIAVSWVWKTNSLYAIENDLVEVFPDIVNGLKDESKSEYQRRDVLILYFRKIGNISALKEILHYVSLDTLGWQIIDLLIPYSTEHIFLVDFLEAIIKDEERAIPVKLDAAKRLIELSNLTGLSFYTDYIIEKNDNSLDYHHFLFLTKITSTEAIPDLLRLLHLSKQPHFQEDKFNGLESSILTSLTNIGLVSEENLQVAKEELLKFIEKHNTELKYIGFLHITIDKMEEQYYMNKSKSYTIDEAIEVLDN